MRRRMRQRRGSTLNVNVTRLTNRIRSIRLIKSWRSTFPRIRGALRDRVRRKRT